MSRSKRKTPIISNTLSGLHGSEKDDKVQANQALRRHNKMLLKDQAMTKEMKEMEDIIILDLIDDVSDVWMFKKDGKHYLDKNSKYYDDKYMRK